MPKVRSGGTKWQRRAAQAAPDYAAGISNPKRQWAEATRASADAWTAGVQQAISTGSFAKAASQEAQNHWQVKAQTLGQQRYGHGVQAALDRYERGFAPYKAVIEGVTLPERGRRGDPANLERTRIMAEALHNARMQRKG